MKNENKKQSGGITDKKDFNAGSGAFNQGTEQDPEYDKGTKVSDKEKKTQHTDSPGAAKEDSREDSVGKK